MIRDSIKHRESSKRWRQQNRERHLASRRRWAKNNPEKCKAAFYTWIKNNPERFKEICRHSALKYNYGLTFVQFKKMRKFQKNRCAICDKKFNKTPHVDHDHITGKIRKLLCGNCNRGLGGFKDSILNLKKAIKYLKET